jgi:hypothetical protein
MFILNRPFTDISFYFCTLFFAPSPA